MQSITSGDVALHAAVDGFALHVTHHAAGTLLRRHDHAAASLQIVLSGEFTEITAGRAHGCTAGSLIYKPAGAHHADRYSSAVDALLIEIEPHADAHRETLVARDAGAAVRAARIVRSLAAPYAGWRLDVEEGVITLLASLDPQRQERTGRRPGWLDDAVDLARAGASLADVSTHVGRHRTHVARVARQILGVSLSTFLRNERLRAAAWRLRTSGRSIAQVGGDCGFFDQSHFTRAFRALFGVTPAQYRRQAQTLHRRRA
jgi:AraC-like DNA-binding protein